MIYGLEWQYGWCPCESSNNTAKILDSEWTIFIFSPEGPCESYATQVRV